MDNSWAFDLERKIFSVIKKKTEQKLKAKYPNIFYTTTDTPKDGETNYPTVYMHLSSSAERGITIEGNSINAVFVMMQIECTTNKSQKEANAVLAEIANAFKELGFEIKSLPGIDNVNSRYRSVARVSKTFGSSDAM